MSKARIETLVDLGDLSAPRGSHPWCVAVREETRSSLINAKSTREHTATWVKILRSDGIFQKLKDRSGANFLTWEAFCTERQPYGFGMRPEEVDAIIESKPLAQQLAADPRVKPLVEHGGDRKTDQGDIVTLKHDRGNNADYLVRRLKRDAPDIAAKLARGEYPSARAAGIAAGIVRVPTPLDLLKRAWGKASKKERESFIDLIGKEGW